MQRMKLWVLAAILICGASVFTACTGDISDIPVKPVGIAIDETNFPDAAFRQCLFDYYKFAKDGILTDEEIKNTTTLEVDWEDIKNLKGIEYFTALEELDCSGNDLTEFDLSMNTKLHYLNCCYNHLTKLNISNNLLLDTLYCDGNELTELDVSNNTALIYLDCYDNKLTELDVTKNTALVQLDFDRNQITSIDLSKNIWLEELYCAGNGLTKLDVSTIQALEMIQCYNNKISGQNMDDLIICLPLNDTPTYFEFAVIDYSEGVEMEGNVITKSQVEAAKAKGWLPQQWDDDEEDWVEYPGSDN